MTLSLPNYIERTGIVSFPPGYTWDDSDPESAYVAMDERLQHRIGQASDRAVLALSAGFAEWVAWRISKYSDDLVLFNKIEAVWAAIIDWRYMKPWTAGSPKDWQGPNRGPLWSAADMLHRTVDLTIREQFAYPESVCLSFLVLHVIPDPKPFKDWRRFTIKRLAKFYPRDMANVLGTPVPREVLDPDFEYKPELAKELLRNFLRGLDPTKNPYLCSSDEMIEAGFEGTPYSV